MRARALYSNEADSTDELSFTKGDILIVVQRDAEDGWWQCTRLKEWICQKSFFPIENLKIIESYLSSHYSGFE